MNFIKRCAATALCLSVLGGTAATLNTVDSVKLPVVATVADAASTNAYVPPSGTIGIGDSYYCKLSDGTYAWCGTKSMTTKTVKIPSTIKVGGVYAKVTEIGHPTRNMSSYTKYITSVTVQANIRKINDNAFAKGNLRTFYMTTYSYLKTIGKNAFQNTSISSFGFTSARALTLIDDNAFAGTRLNSVNFKNNTALKTLGNSAFKAVPVSGWIYIPSTLEKIGTDCFKSCKNITGIGINPNNATASGDLYRIGHGAFKGWTCKNANVFIPVHYRSVTCGETASGEAVFGATKTHNVTVTVDFSGTGRVRAVTLKSKEDVAAFKAGYLKFKRSGKIKTGKLQIIDATGSKNVVLSNV